MTAALEFQHVTFQYDAQAVPTLRDINLTIQPGERILIAGPSGSGKTTLGQLINGLIPHAYPGELSGKILINGKDVTTTSIFERSFSVGTVLQDTDAQFVGLSVAEDIAFALENDNATHDEIISKVQRWADVLDLPDLLKIAPQRLSGGQKQRVAMAGVLVDDSPILLFDEPLASLDPASGHRMLALLDKLQAEYGLTVVMIEHRLEDVLQHRLDRVVVLEDGQVTFDDTPDTLLRSDTLHQYGLAVPGYLQVVQQTGFDLNAVTGIRSPKTIDGVSLDERLTQLVLPKIKATEKAKEALLTIDRLSFDFGDRTLFNQLSAEIYDGELVALVGKNGSGKSTLSKLITGFITPTSGKLSLANVGDLGVLSIKERASYIGYVSQNPNEMITQAIIFDEVASGLRLRGVAEEDVTQQVNNLLRLAGLYEMRNWPVTVLSYGQKKRLTILSVLALQPEVLILDEPTAGQDYANAQAIMQFVRHLHDELGTTVIVITHDMALMLRVAERALVLVDGELIADTTPADLLTNEELVEKAALHLTTVYDLAQRFNLANPAALTQLIAGE
ncbi:ATP-binding cassette domain-containing protein [Weissella cibaria]|uniref:ABC transporter ATP-binding protein n=1 Tax=Weissella cibaria TaxID=137591 RepID=UPI001D03925D|nr:ABC transporter ATP-binding protein [Weissella cibaria]MCB5827174.1 ATP-binding cassette domain-containing protein [Weissella cibaria]MCB5858755.1 ATP-binding cassette domain-containing protein [Weissella cibaria]MCB5860964.1 ATP-binding cassette domain-containing protein [Weissella cibaria]MCB5863291.1 ATP-binding cassette domain-containing protein [Weissella cibaria]MCB5865481.1 ATP-binding cassette domain-containing protein [Weissella cibaria]